MTNAGESFFSAHFFMGQVDYRGSAGVEDFGIPFGDLHLTYFSLMGIR